MAYELPSRVVQAAGERTGVRARAIAGRGSMIAHPARSPCGARPARQTSVRREACPPARRPRRTPPDLRAVRGLPARSPSTPRASLGTPLPDLRATHPARPPRNAPRQTSVRREACPPAHRPRRELRSARRLEARPGPAGLAPPSDRATMTTGTATSIPTSFARHTTARPPCGARPARPLAVHAASFARRVASKPGQALQASRHPPIGPPPTGTAATTPHTSLPFFLWLPRLLLQHMTTAGNTADEIGEHSGSQRDKTLPAQLISRSNGTKFSLRVIKRSFWPVLRMQGEFYPGYDIHGPQQGEFYPGILVAHGPHPGSAMIIHVLLARQRP